jgi:hypothetical protein
LKRNLLGQNEEEIIFMSKQIDGNTNYAFPTELREKAIRYKTRI